jgi:gamma-glutamylcyclotransferase (GGCT)/AIG2-like uncharacterized protein YtfP
MRLPEDAHVLRELDAYEGYNPQDPEASEYIREKQRIELDAGGVVECWFYRYNWKTDEMRRIESGRWGCVE